MESKIRHTGKASSMASGLGAGGTVSLTVTVLGAMGIGKMLDLQKLEWKNTGYVILFLLLIGSFTGALTASEKIKRRKLLVCAVSGGIYWAELLLITALFFGGQYEAVGVTALLITAGSVSAALLTAGKGRGAGKKRRNHR